MVNELSETKPTSLSGIKRLKAENKWIKFSNGNNLPSSNFQTIWNLLCSEQYFKRLISGQAKIVKKKITFSRIHVEYCKSFISFNEKFKKMKFIIFQMTNQLHKETALYGSKLLKVKSPEFLELNSLEDGMLKDFYKDSKKVDNQKVKNFLIIN